MYKKQMKFQKAVCLLVLAASVIVFLYSLGIMTDLYDALYTTIGAPDKPDNTRRNPVAGAFIYYDMQGFNLEAKQRWHEEHWQEELQNAFDAGKRMAEKLNKLP